MAPWTQRQLGLQARLWAWPLSLGNHSTAGPQEFLLKGKRVSNKKSILRIGPRWLSCLLKHLYNFHTKDEGMVAKETRTLG